MIHFKFVCIKDMHNIYYLGLSGERLLPFGLLVCTCICKQRRHISACSTSQSDQQAIFTAVKMAVYFKRVNVMLECSQYEI